MIWSAETVDCLGSGYSGPDPHNSQPDRGMSRAELVGLWVASVTGPPGVLGKRSSAWPTTAVKSTAELHTDARRSGYLMGRTPCVSEIMVEAEVYAEC